jgi:hypothetical protein
MPPVARPFPRFIADTPRDSRAYGDWEERLGAAFADACEKLAGDAGAPLDRESLRYFPDRTWGGTTYVPVTGHGAGEDPLEYFGHVSYRREEDGSPGELSAEADFTDVVADDNPDWDIDLNDDVIGEWRADGGRGGEVTLIWGVPLTRGAIAASAEFENGDVLDQTAVNDGRFTLIAVDAVHGFGDAELFLEVRLWDRRLNLVAAESLYEVGEDEEGPDDDGAVDLTDLAEQQAQGERRD